MSTVSKQSFGMKFVPLVILSLTIFCPSVLAETFSKCERVTGDAGRWEDSQSPSGRLDEMCRTNQHIYQGQKGTMVLSNINSSDCGAAISYAKEQESWHGDWFLWSHITCTNGMEILIK